jgi:hypothetical protein
MGAPSGVGGVGGGGIGVVGSGIGVGVGVGVGGGGVATWHAVTVCTRIAKRSLVLNVVS